MSAAELPGPIVISSSVPDAAPTGAAVAESSPTAAASRLAWPVCAADGQSLEDDSGRLVAGCQGEGGNYLLGQNLSWHGGIHLTDHDYPQHVRQQPLRCLMDGTVVAWRLNRRYPTQSWGDSALHFSSSFCLIRHDYCSPVGEQGAQNRLRLYSLYMHLADYQHYQPVTAEPQEILRLRQRIYVRKAEQPEQRLGKLGVGSLLRPSTQRRRLHIRERQQGRTLTRELEFVLASVLEKAPGSSNDIVVGSQVWVADTTEYLEHDHRTLNPPVAELPAFYCRYQLATLQKPQSVYRSPEQWQQRRAEGRLQVGSTLRIDRQQSLSLTRPGCQQAQTVYAAEIEQGINGEAPSPLRGQIWLSIEPDLARLQPEAPQQFDVIVASNCPIQAGAPVGYAGRYDYPVLSAQDGQSQVQHQVHIELFSDETASRIEQWLENGAAVKGNTAWACLSGDEPLYLLTDAVPRLCNQQADGGQCVRIRRQFEQDEQQWCELDPVRCGTRTQVGVLVPYQSLTVCDAHDLARQGFRLVPAGENNEQQVVIELQGNRVPGVFSRTLLALDLDQDGVLEANELLQALQTAQDQGQLARLLVRHDSEWGQPWQRKILQFLQQQQQRLHALPAGYLSDDERQQQQRQLQLIALEKQRISQLGIDLALFNQPLVFMHPLMIVQSLKQALVIASLVTKEMLVVLVPEMAHENCDELLHYLNQFMALFEINTPLRICHFLAQMAHESRFKPRAENLNYTSTRRMHEIFGCSGGPRNYNASTDSCSRGVYTGRQDLWNNPQNYTRHPAALGSLVYSSNMENGPPESGDGYKYRARGLIQLTWKKNYRLFTEFHNEAFPNDRKDFTLNPELISHELKYAVESAGFYWSMNALNGFADIDNIRSITLVINGGQNGIQERRELLCAIKGYFDI